MILFKRAIDLRKWIDNQRLVDEKIGFVPTMGALHDGHISLLESSKAENFITICSIFVNPTQFNDPADFKKYPVTIEKDIRLLEEAGCDLLFLPPVSEIYPEGFSEKKEYELGFLETVLEGKFRPGHFQGVCMVVQRLLEIVLPDRLYLGQKDYQQCMVIKKLVDIIDLKEKIKITICPTLREPNGLAMSSRNMRLGKEEKIAAGTIFRTLTIIKENFGKQSPGLLKQKAGQMLMEAGLKPDYIEIADAGNLSAVHHWEPNKKMVALIAAFMNEVRLIDNMLLN